MTQTRTGTPIPTSRKKVPLFYLTWNDHLLEGESLLVKLKRVLDHLQRVITEQFMEITG